MMNPRNLLASIFLSFALTTCVWQPAMADSPCKACQGDAHHHCDACDHHGSHQCCPPAPPCCRDAKICVRADNAPVCYTDAGVRAFMTLFRAAAEKGVENATIRAFNATTVAPPCEVCGHAKDGDHKHADDKDEKKRDDDDDHKRGDDKDGKKQDDDRKEKGDQDKKPSVKK